MTKYEIDGPWRGKLFIIARPRGGDWLEDDIASMRREGFDLLVSLLTQDEKQELGLQSLGEVGRSLGLRLVEFPITDLGTPDSMSEAEALLARVHDELAAGKKVAIHCRQGIGRSGLIAIGLLLLSGQQPAEAMRKVSAARGLPVPETIEQRDWLYTLEHELSAPAAKR